LQLGQKQHRWEKRKKNPPGWKLTRFFSKLFNFPFKVWDKMMIFLWEIGGDFLRSIFSALILVHKNLSIGSNSNLKPSPQLAPPEFIRINMAENKYDKCCFSPPRFFPQASLVWHTIPMPYHFTQYPNTNF